MSLQDKVVLITGATGGVGPTVVRAVAKTSARMVLTARKQEALQELTSGLSIPPERLLLHVADLAVAGDVQALMEAIAAPWGGVDVLLNVAGGWRGGTRLAELTEEEWDGVMALNLRSAYLINRAVLPYMLKKGWGRIVNIAAKAAVEPGARQAAYNVSKAGVVALTASIAAEYRRQGIAANVILPSIIDTPHNRATMPDADTTRWVRPEEIAALMLYLCSDEGAALNGASIAMYGRV